MHAFLVSSEDEFPVFGRVMNIYVWEKKVVFSVQHLHTHSFDPHYHSYRVQNTTTSSEFIDYDVLLSHDPLHERLISGQAFISLKHRLVI